MVILVAARTHQTQSKNEGPREFIVRDFMSRNVLTVDPDSSVSKAIEIMVQQKVGCIPIVSEKVLCGIVTRHDILKILARFL